MQIVLRYTAPLVDFTGKRSETVDVPEGASVEEPMFMVTRNGQVTEAYHEPLAGGDEVALVAGFAGG